MQHRGAAGLQSTPGVGAVVLAGGRGSRLGGLDKALLELDGATLLDRLLAALGGTDVVVVGPPRDGLPDRVRVVREQPAFGGPAAALVAGLAALPAGGTDVLVLAVDVPAAHRAVPLLLAPTAEPDGVVALDPGGREQWLLGRYSVAALRAAASRREGWAGRPLRELVGALDVARLPLPADVTRDVDTVADARAAGVRLQDGEEARMSDEDVLGTWWTFLSAALGLEDVPADREAILALAGEAAHAVVRPAAPLTTFLAGYAAGRAGGSADDVQHALEQARAAAAAQ